MAGADDDARGVTFERNMMASPKPVISSRIVVKVKLVLPRLLRFLSKIKEGLHSLFIMRAVLYCTVTVPDRIGLSVVLCVSAR